MAVITAQSEVAEGSVMAEKLHSGAEDRDVFTAGLLTIFILLILLVIFGFNYITPILTAFVSAVLTAFFVAGQASKKIGGLTGDVYGTIVEVSEIVILLVFVIF